MYQSAWQQYVCVCACVWGENLVQHQVLRHVMSQLSERQGEEQWRRGGAEKEKNGYEGLEDGG